MIKYRKRGTDTIKIGVTSLSTFNIYFGYCMHFNTLYIFLAFVERIR